MRALGLVCLCLLTWAPPASALDYESNSGTGATMFSAINNNGVAVEADGDVLVVDNDTTITHNRVDVFTATGTLKTTIGKDQTHGTVGFETGEIGWAYDVAVAPNGDVYVMDGGRDIVQIFRETAPNVYTYQNGFGQAGTNIGEFSVATGISVAADGSVYTADSPLDRITKFTSTGTPLYMFTPGPANEINTPVDVHVDGSNVYVAEYDNNRVAKLIDTGSSLGLASMVPYYGAGQSTRVTSVTTYRGRVVTTDFTALDFYDAATGNAAGSLSACCTGSAINPRGLGAAGDGIYVADARSAAPGNRVIRYVNRPPVASFTNSAPTANASVTLTSTSTDETADADTLAGSIALVEWDLDDDGAFDDATGPTTTKTAPASGSFRISVRVTDNEGATATSSRDISVTAAVGPRLTVLRNGSDLIVRDPSNVGGADFITVGTGSGTVTFQQSATDGTLQVGAAGCSLDVGTDDAVTCSLSGATGILVELGAGNDVLNASVALPAALTGRGGEGTDTLNGSSGGDRLNGGAGADLIVGGGGDDELDGGGGLFLAGVIDDGAADSVSGGDGNDSLFGGLGGDTLSGGAGADTLSYADDGRTSNPATRVGVSVAIGATGQGAPGEGDNVADDFEVLLGSPYADVLRAGTAAATLAGGTGDDVLISGPGNDTLQGGDNNDSARYDGSGPVTLTVNGTGVRGGPAGQDDAIAADVETVVGSEQADTFSFAGAIAGPVLDGGAGNDKMIGSNEPNTLRGGAGDDEVCGSGGNDSEYGDAGNDLVGGDCALGTFNDTGNDFLDGGDGNDVVRTVGVRFAPAATGFQSDTVRGGAGDDNFNMVNGVPSDYEGGAGKDTIFLQASGIGATFLIRVTLDGVANDGVYDYKPGANPPPASENSSNVKQDVEVIVGTAKDDYIYAGAVGAGLIGGDGDDYLAGGPGNDVIDGGKGFDWMPAGAGNDQIFAKDLKADSIGCGTGVNTVDADPIDLLAQDCAGLGLTIPIGVAPPTTLPIKTIKVGDGQTAPTKVACPANLTAAVRACAVEVKFVGRRGTRATTGPVYGRASAEIAEDTAATVSVKLTRPARKLLTKAGKLVVDQTATFTLDGQTFTATRKLTLKGKKG